MQNLLKYAMGLPPLTSGSPNIAVLCDGTNMILNYSRGSAATDVQMHAQWSTDLSSWSNSGVTESMLSDDGTIQRWQAKWPNQWPATDVYAAEGDRDLIELAAIELPVRKIAGAPNSAGQGISRVTPGRRSKKLSGRGRSPWRSRQMFQAKTSDVKRAVCPFHSTRIVGAAGHFISLK